MTHFKNLKEYLEYGHWGFPAISIISMAYSDKSIIVDENEQPISFYLGVGSNIFYQTIQINGDDSDYTKCAYQNALRYNSFLRSLSDIWKNKYNWNIEWTGTINPYFDRTKFSRIEDINGIYLDGKLRYYD